MLEILKSGTFQSWFDGLRDRRDNRCPAVRWRQADTRCGHQAGNADGERLGL